LFYRFGLERLRRKCNDYASVIYLEFKIRGKERLAVHYNNEQTFKHI